MKGKQVYRYFIETSDTKANLFRVKNEERAAFWVSNPNAKEVDRNVYEAYIRVTEHLEKQKAPDKEG